MLLGAGVLIVKTADLDAAPAGVGDMVGRPTEQVGADGSFVSFVVRRRQVARPVRIDRG